MKYLCFLSVVGAVLHPWEPWVWRAGGLLVIAIIWGHVPRLLLYSLLGTSAWLDPSGTEPEG